MPTSLDVMIPTMYVDRAEYGYSYENSGLVTPAVICTELGS
jgi:hypothetical protein